MRTKAIVQRIVLGLTAVWSLAASGDTLTLADDYIVAPLDISTNTTLIASPNFAAILDAPLTGSSTLTLQGGYVSTASSMLTLANKDGNTFSGDIVVDTDGGWFTLAGNIYAPVGPQQGGMLPNMGAGNAITVKRGGYFYINDAVSTTLGYIANRLGSEGDHPAVTLQGGYFRLNGVNVAATESEQTLGDLTIDVGPATVEVLRGNQTTATPKLIFTRLSRNAGGTVNITGTSLGTAASGCAQILFGTPPTLDAGGLIGGWARSLNDWATYDTYGVTPVTSYGATIQGAAATDNIKITAAQTITGNNTINSLNWNFNGNLDLQTYALTLVSGGYLKQNNNANSLLGTTGYVTAGAGDGAAAALTVYHNVNQVLTWSALIKDNPAGSGNAVAFIDDGVGSVTFGQASDNDYSGGTFLNWGTLTTGTAANRRYLGTGPVRVGNGILVLGAKGATENTTFPDYTAVNGGQIQIPNVAMTEDTFTIAANSVINTVGTLGLNSLDRGMDGLSAVTNIVLDADAIIGHPALTTALNLDTGTIKNLGTAADLYYGLAANQGNPAGSITVGTGAPFKGISTDRSARAWQLGTINVAPGTSAINFRGLSVPGAVPVALIVGNGATYGGPVVSLAEAGTVDIHVIGYLTLNVDGGLFGDTTAGKNVRFVVKSGSQLIVSLPNGLGSGSGIASVLVEKGGILVIGAPDALNGDVTVEAGGKLVANQVGGLVGTGALTLKSGSIVDITAATGFSGAQAMAADFGDEVIVRMHAASLGSPVASLYTFLKGKAPILETYGAYWPVNPEIADTTVIRLRDGGTLVNDTATRSIAAVPNGKIAIGTNGAVIAATANTIFTIAQPLEMGSNSVLTIGSSNAYDGIAPRLGTVKLTAANLYSTAAPGASINVIPGATLSQGINALPQYVDLNVDGTFLMGGADTIGSLSGSGQIVQGASILTVGRNQESSTYSGAWAGTGAIYKSGTGRLDIASSITNTGAMTVNNGILALSGDGTTLNAGVGAFALIGDGTLLLDNSSVNNTDRLTGTLPGITFQGGTFRFLGKDTEAASESLGVGTFSFGHSTIDIVNGTGTGSSATLTFSGIGASPIGTVNFTSSGAGTLGSDSDADSPFVKFTAGVPAGLIGWGTVGSAPAYYDSTYGVRAFDIGDGTEFDGGANQTGLNTVFTSANTDPMNLLTLARPVNSLWIDNPGVGKSIDTGSSGDYNLTLTTGRLLLTGTDDFEITRSGTSTAGIIPTSTRLYVDVDNPDTTLTLSLPAVETAAHAVIKEGSGTLVLNAPQAFTTGGLRINNGTVTYGVNGDLTATAVLNIWNNGVFDFAGATDTIGAATIYSGGITNSAAEGELTVTALTMGSGSGPAGYAAYANSGTGTLKLGGNVTFTAVNDPNTATIAGNLDLGAATRTFVVNDSVAEDAYVDMDIPAILSGTAGAGVTKTGTGTLRLGGDNTFDGPVSVAGTLRLSHPNALGSPSAARALTVAASSTLAFDGENGDITVPANYTPVSLSGTGNTLIGILSGSLVNRSGSNTVLGPVTLAANTQLALLGGKLTLANTIGGNFAMTLYGPGDSEFGGTYGGMGILYKNGGGALTLSGNTDNTRAGTTFINSGKVLLNKDANKYAINAGLVTISSGGSLEYAAGNANNNQINSAAVSLNGTGELDFNGAVDTIGNVIIVSSTGASTNNTTPIKNTAGGGNLTIGALTVTPVSGYFTTIDSSSGTLTLDGNVASGATASGTGKTKISGTLDLGAATRTFTVTAGTAPYAPLGDIYDMDIDAVISGPAGIGFAKAGTGSLRLSGSNTFDGALSAANSVGTLILANPQALGTPSVPRTMTFGTADTLALQDVGTLTSPSSLITLSLNGVGNARVGPVYGALANLSGVNTVPCAIKLAGTTTFASIKDKMILANEITGAFPLTVIGEGDTELRGALATTTLIKNSTGTLKLSGASANTHSGLTTVNIGTLLLGKTGSFNAIANGGLTIATNTLVQYTGSSTDMMGTGQVTINGTGQLDLNGTTDTIGNVLIVSASATADTMPITNSAGGGNLTIGALTVTPVADCDVTIGNGSGTLTLGGNVVFAAATTGRAKISGLLDLGNDTRLFTIANGTGPDYDLLIDANISSAAGAFGITKTTAGSTLVLTGTNSYTGINTLLAGILRAQGHPNALGLSTAANAVALTTANILELAGDTDLAFGRNVTVSISNPRLVSDRVTPGDGTMHTMGRLTIRAHILNIDGGANVTGGVAGVAFTGVTLAGGTTTFNVTPPAAGGTTRLTLGNVDNGANLLTVRGIGDTLITGVMGSGLTNSGGLTKLDTGTLVLAGPGLYTGTTLISAGVVMLAHRQAAANSLVNNPLADGLRFGGGTAFTIGGLTGAGAISLTNTTGEGGITLTVGENNANASYTGLLSGPGGIAKIGTGSQILANITLTQYEGDTTVSNGVLQINAPLLPTTGDVILSAPGKLYLNFAGTNAVRYLYVDGVKRFGGVYSSANLPDHITGAGVLLVESPPELLCLVQAETTVGEPDDFFTFFGVYSGNNTNITSYAWDFDDNGTIDASTATASRQFPATGEYKVRLTVVNEADETATALWVGTISTVPKTLYIKSWYTPDNTEGHVWGYTAFTNFTQAVASNIFIPYWSEGFVESIVPTNYPTIEAAIEDGVSHNPDLGINFKTTVLVYTNTAPGSDGEYTNAETSVAFQMAGFNKPWRPKDGMTIMGVPRTNVTVRGGFISGTALGGSQGSQNITIDGLRILEGCACRSAGETPNKFFTYQGPGAGQGGALAFTVRNCYFGPLIAGIYQLSTDLGNIAYPGSFVIENNFFEPGQVRVSSTTNGIIRGNLFKGVRVYSNRGLDITIANNTFKFGGAVDCQLDYDEVRPYVLTNYVINNNFINSPVEGYTMLALSTNSLITWVATNNWWGTINGPYDPTNSVVGETLENTVEVDETNVDYWNFAVQRNMEPEGGFLGWINDRDGAAAGTNVMYVPWATDKLLVNEYTTEEDDDTPLDVWVGNNYTSAGPGASWFGGFVYKWGINAVTNITTAIELLTEGGTVWLAPETFEIGEQVTIQSAVKIVGTKDVTTVTMAPGGESRCFYIDSIYATLKGIVISNGYAKGTGPDGCGGGVYINTMPSDVTAGPARLDGCRVVGCRADIDGGGVCIADIYSIYGGYIHNSTISGNTAMNNGGGIASSNWLYLGQSTVDNNTAPQGNGGGVYVGTYIPTAAESANTHAIHDDLGIWTVISNNTAFGDGGGAYFDANSRFYNHYTWGNEFIRQSNLDHFLCDWAFVNNRSLIGSGGGAYARKRNSGNYDRGPHFFGCTFLGNEAANNGGGIYISTGKLDTCTFVNNAATNQGGGAYIDGVEAIPTAQVNIYGVNPSPWVFVGNKGTPPDGMTNNSHWVGAVTRCTFDGNRSGSGDGGGIYVTGSGFDARSSVWGLSSLVGNRADSGSGGGIAMADSKLTLSLISGLQNTAMLDTNIMTLVYTDGLQSASNNVAALCGGAIYASNAVLENCVFTANQAERGGALYLEKSMLSRSTLIGNAATDQGGGVYMTAGSTMRNSLVSENAAGSRGGGLYMVASTNESCTVVANSAPAGSGIGMEDGWVRNSIIWMNNPQSATWYVADGTVEYSCAPPSGASGEGNIVSDPRFMHIGRKDYRLAIESHCLDRGTNATWMITATDLIGEARILNDIVDMGAYEGAAGFAPKGIIFLVK